MPSNGMQDASTTTTPAPAAATATPLDASAVDQAVVALQDALQRFQRAMRASGLLDHQAADPAFEALRKWRTEQARAKQVPPYVIATDAVLREIAARRPADLQELKEVRGIGASKAELYGSGILEVMAKVS